MIIYILIYLFFSFSNLLFSQNEFPIVLIHGFMGWGVQEMGEYSYWGGERSYTKKLEENGYRVIELSVGPVSSNWERAVEAYYQLKGGQVDYGKGHADKYKIIQKPEGKIYDGLYTEWSSDNPIHIIGHSMGGQTARMLNYLLTQEIYIDKDYTLKEKSILLGESNNGMIKSITSIATPHNGTTLTEIVTKTIPFIQYFVGVAGVMGTNYYNFDLEQWNFTREKFEPWSSYLNRMRNHIAWGTKNISAWDLSLDGSKELNNYLHASPDIYYFSIVLSTTIKREKESYHDPDEASSILIKIRSKLLGSMDSYWSDGNKTDSLWYENDGVVNTVSMYGPSTGINGSDPIVKYEKTGLLMPGQWYWIKILEMDHWSIIGHLGDIARTSRAEKHFFDHIKIIKSL
ncbi:MAG: esterase/lipase family protein [Candidatus Neomarinimicrobiota bacterium]